MFELLVTIVAVIGLVLFAGVTLPHFEMGNLELDTLPFGYHSGLLGGGVGRQGRFEGQAGRVRN